MLGDGGGGRGREQNILPGCQINADAQYFKEKLCGQIEGSGVYYTKRDIFYYENAAFSPLLHGADERLTRKAVMTTGKRVDSGQYGLETCL